MDMKQSPSEKSIQNINICIWVEGEIFTYMLLYKILWNDKKKVVLRLGGLRIGVEG